MSVILRLSITSLRNIGSVTVEPIAGANLLYGENGSGKTSFLESLHLLASGRSFRSSKLDPLIQHDVDELVVFAELSGNSQIGLTKSRRQSHRLQLNGEKQPNWEYVARELPIQVLDSSSFLLLEGGPKSRRRFLDWGVFHVERSFVSNWRRTRKCIANRNLLLKSRRPDRGQIAAWDNELCDAAQHVDLARSSYFNQFLPVFSEVYKTLLGSKSSTELELTYDRGWDGRAELSEVLAQGFEIDSRYGATQSGPHRADILVKVSGHKAVDILSRGQQKMMVSAMKIAQGELLAKVLDRRCIYLVDDLPAELDRDNRSAVFHQLLGLGGQLFVTCVDLESMESSLPDTTEIRKFHVEHGTITT